MSLFDTTNQLYWFQRGLWEHKWPGRDFTQISPVSQTHWLSDWLTLISRLTREYWGGCSEARREGGRVDDGESVLEAHTHARSRIQPYRDRRGESETWRRRRGVRERERMSAERVALVPRSQTGPRWDTMGCIGSRTISKTLSVLIAFLFQVERRPARGREAIGDAPLACISPFRENVYVSMETFWLKAICPPGFDRDSARCSWEAGIESSAFSASGNWYPYVSACMR